MADLTLSKPGQRVVDDVIEAINRFELRVGRKPEVIWLGLREVQALCAGLSVADPPRGTINGIPWKMFGDCLSCIGVAKGVE